MLLNILVLSTQPQGSFRVEVELRTVLRWAWSEDDRRQNFLVPILWKQNKLQNETLYNVDMVDVMTVNMVLSDS